MKNLKTTIITVLLLLATVSGAVAQEKWEYAVVKYQSDAKKYRIYTSILTNYTVETGAVEEGYAMDNFTPVLKYIDKLIQQGWEVYSIGNTASSQDLLYHLRKKKN